MKLEGSGFGAKGSAFREQGSGSGLGAEPVVWSLGAEAPGSVTGSLRSKFERGLGFRFYKEWAALMIIIQLRRILV